MSLNQKRGEYEEIPLWKNKYAHTIEITIEIKQNDL